MANAKLRRDIERLIAQGAHVVADPSHRAQLVLRAPGDGGGVKKVRVVKPDGTPTPAGIELQRQLNENPALRVGERFNLLEEGAEDRGFSWAFRGIVGQRPQFSNIFNHTILKIVQENL